MILCRHRPGLGAGGDRCQGPAGAPPGASAVGSFSSLSSVPWAAGAVQALGEGNGPESWGGGDTGGGSCWLRAGSAQALRTAQRGGLWPSLQPLIPCLLLSSRSSPACGAAAQCWMWWTAAPCSTGCRWKVPSLGLLLWLFSSHPTRGRCHGLGSGRQELISEFLQGLLPVPGRRGFGYQP